MGKGENWQTAVEISFGWEFVLGNVAGYQLPIKSVAVVFFVAFDIFRYIFHFTGAINRQVHLFMTFYIFSLL